MDYHPTKSHESVTTSRSSLHPRLPQQFSNHVKVEESQPSCTVLVRVSNCEGPGKIRLAYKCSPHPDKMSRTYDTLHLSSISTTDVATMRATYGKAQPCPSDDNFALADFLCASCPEKCVDAVLSSNKGKRVKIAHWPIDYFPPKSHSRSSPSSTPV